MAAPNTDKIVSTAARYGHGDNIVLERVQPGEAAVLIPR